VRLLKLIASLKYIKLLLLKVIYVKKGVCIKSPFFNYETKILHDSTIMEGTVTDHATSIGSYCYIGRYCYLTKVSIGNYCSIANNVSIGQGQHALDDVSTSSLFYGNSYEDLTKEDCVIGNDVWIGVDSIILRGVEIGNGAVVGANSVVTKNVPPFAIVVGSPAKIIKYRFDDAKIQRIESSKWWMFKFKQAKEIIFEIKAHD